MSTRITKAEAASELEIDINASEDEIRSAYKVVPFLQLPSSQLYNHVQFNIAEKSSAMAPR